MQAGKSPKQMEEFPSFSIRFRRATRIRHGGMAAGGIRRPALHGHRRQVAEGARQARGGHIGCGLGLRLLRFPNGPTYWGKMMKCWGKMVNDGEMILDLEVALMEFG